MKNAKLALANKLKKANPDMDFKTASSMVATTVNAATSSSASDSSGRTSKRAKRSHDESLNEEDDSQVQTPADQLNGQPQGDDSTLVNYETPADETLADNLTQVNDHAQAVDHRNHDQDQQPAGIFHSEEQVQPSMEQAKYPAHDDQMVMMQQGGSFSRQDPQAP